MENMIISVSLTLFMLSLITEKISNFIKLYVPSLTNKADNDAGEKIRERKIQLITVGIGVLVALACNVDFFVLISEQSKIEPFTALSFKAVVGCIITGLFLSQGSKFFHDLLNTILYFKNMRKAIYNKQEIENSQMLSSSYSIDSDLFGAVSANQRQDDVDVNQ